MQFPNMYIFRAPIESTGPGMVSLIARASLGHSSGVHAFPARKTKDQIGNSVFKHLYYCSRGPTVQLRLKKLNRITEAGC